MGLFMSMIAQFLAGFTLEAGGARGTSEGHGDSVDVALVFIFESRVATDLLFQ